MHDNQISAPQNMQSKSLSLFPSMMVFLIFFRGISSSISISTASKISFVKYSHKISKIPLSSSLMYLERQTLDNYNISSLESCPFPSSSAILINKLILSLSVLALMITISLKNSSQSINPE